MKIFIPRETARGERRAPVVPETAAKLVKLGAEVEVESGVGQTIGQADDAYAKAGASVSQNRLASLSSADLVLRLRKPPAEEVGLLKPGSVHVSYLDPFNEPELVRALARQGVSAVSMEMIPRTTLAQKMDALSSQANLGGYVAVILAADRLDRIFPMLMTPAGTISPARVFIVGVGVAGLQAIATARRLGARVDAFDTRPVVEEQVRSLGAKFVKIDLGETGETAQGYAKALTEEQLRRQREGMARVCAQSDVVITTAQVFGRKAPLIVTTEMVEGMRPGSVVVDMAVESGQRRVLEAGRGGRGERRPRRRPRQPARPRRLPREPDVLEQPRQLRRALLGQGAETPPPRRRGRDHQGLPDHLRQPRLQRDHPQPPGGPGMILLVFVFVLAIFLGVELISRVPSQLHTPLMSGSNAISGITIVAALVAVGTESTTLANVLGTLAVVAATINVVGGYLVTDRMLAMFKKKDDKGQ